MTEDGSTYSAVNPRPLGNSYVKNTYHYELVERIGNVAIFKQRLRPGAGELAYEVITIHVAPATTMFGKEVPAREVAPANEAFGFTAWSFPTLERARAKFAERVAAATSNGVSKADPRGTP